MCHLCCQSFLKQKSGNTSKWKFFESQVPSTKQDKAALRAWRSPSKKPVISLFSNLISWSQTVLAICSIWKLADCLYLLGVFSNLFSIRQCTLLSSLHDSEYTVNVYRECTYILRAYCKQKIDIFFYITFKDMKSLLDNFDTHNPSKMNLVS